MSDEISHTQITLNLYLPRRRTVVPLRTPNARLVTLAILLAMTSSLSSVNDTAHPP